MVIGKALHGFKDRQNLQIASSTSFVNLSRQKKAYRGLDQKFAYGNAKLTSGAKTVNTSAAVLRESDDITVLRKSSYMAK